MRTAIECPLKHPFLGHLFSHVFICIICPLILLQSEFLEVDYYLPEMFSTILALATRVVM